MSKISIWIPKDSLGGGAGFGLESSGARGIVRDMDGQHFERDIAAESGVAGAVDLPHSSGAENLIASEGGSDARSSRLRREVPDLPYEAVG